MFRITHRLARSFKRIKKNLSDATKPLTKRSAILPLLYLSREKNKKL